ncbi:MAG: hypothetical protein EWV75_04760 [Microcystis wesenbergii Mw_QC_S_20081001_S30D]|uniref:Uncharacterized protein n=1 Tax=Microcystis wesenbergii Mw_QC_S_20081001_S30D TaxID=2486245 RepID=A0A552JVV9_9CHRO|nr:MAG: hypothetical protein EWV75_04760 [Microcystis wesenbergii Mw_QC_S_20081001_S30D]TRV02429.1 MAG: hypothetical protein EWV74_08860 [Microcystis wesenbergii Mw_QC_S_20081001_S30]TRV05664.1 MAG: hypothetical protein EWV73_00150 [Microcystis wesenbergii Mw_QC_B_20070930_S4D]TRV09794.1 MAG: hypothetical protein EWV89_18165 [Microcystis wesenbergii Mw_QC_B_20070930_S4]
MQPIRHQIFAQFPHSCHIQLSVVSYQLSVVSYQWSVISYQLLKARGNRHSCKRQNLTILLPKKRVRN